ncbi:MAX dimerization protein MGA a [Hoplias malabaricus]|uniref:MAX dimerization protein MGA a n=1 Tax=Hoplias malabaricus TaxID=27720 RepID=UPI0034626611
MAITDKQAIMVIHPEGLTTSTLANQVSSAHSLFVVLKPILPGDGGLDKKALFANKEARPLETSTTGFQKLPSMSVMAGSNSGNQLCNFPAESTCKGITVTLDNNNMWNEFYKCQTEMILTKQGRRMFPYCRFRISGLEPFQSYTFVMDMHPVDNHRYKWSDRRWETNGKADQHILRSFVHPGSPATGLDWMQNPVSFYKLKLTNNSLDQEGHIIINSMHRYLPRLHIIPADKAKDGIELNGPEVVTFSFPQTEFFAVTAYQNLSITQLKIDYNPFAKGFRDDATNSRSCKPKNGLSAETMENDVKPSRETTTLNNLKTLFAKRNATEKVLKGQSLSVPTDQDLKAANGNSPVPPEHEKSCSKKRPWPEGLSELIKGSHVKVKRTSLQDSKVQDGSDSQISHFSLPAGDEKLGVTANESQTEHISVKVGNKEEVESSIIKESGIVNAKNITTLVSQVTDLSKVQNTTGMCPKTSETNTNVHPNTNEIMDIAVSEMASVKEGRETSHSVVKPLDCVGEVKKKRAEPVPLPLLALFLQQLKTKTRPTRPKSICDSSSSQSQSEKSYKTSVGEDMTPPVESSAETLPTPTESFSSSLPTQSNSQTAASLSSETVTSTILTSTIDSTTVSKCLSILPTVSYTLTISPTLPEMPSPEKPSTSLAVTDSGQVPEPALAEQKTLSRLDYDTNIDTKPTEDIVSDTVFISKQKNAELSAVAVSTVLSSFHSDSVPDNNVSKFVSDHFSALSSSSPTKTFSAIISDSCNNETVCSNAINTESNVDPTLDYNADLCAEFVPDTPDHSSLSDVNEDIPFSPSSPPSPQFSIPSPAPSSPDPFPPGLFSDRPIPPRKTLDPFPPCLSFDRPRLPVDSFDTVPQSFIFTKKPCPRETGPITQSISNELTCSTLAPEPCIPVETNQSLQESTSKKTKMKHKKGGKLKRNEDVQTIEGPIPVPMQPNLEDVEGHLFVSFMSKKALKIHLGDEAKDEALQKPTENMNGEDIQNVEEQIDALEKVLLRDLKFMKHRQVIHPVLQAVGLKLNLLDLTLAIDLQYLGVCLPIPPPVLLPGESSGSSSSSQVPFVSRTGKTTDFTKIKGWREKFVTSSSSLPCGSSLDTGQKNLSAFCSDMLDEYLESEGKLIDERAASFSQAVVTPVAYQLPTKSTSYVRTLDSVLKKQAPPSTATTFKPSFASKKNSLASSKKSKSGAVKKSSSTEKPSSTSGKDAPKIEHDSSKKSTKFGASKPGYDMQSAPFSVSPNKKTFKIKNKNGSKTLQASALPGGTPLLKSTTVSSVDQDCTSSTPVGRNTGLSKTLVKLLDVEDGAVWEGKHRTCITEERAAIALSALVTAKGTVNGSPTTIIKRRAPPCLNDFCRLGCVCASLAQERRRHHCGKPQCMLGCDCLRRKVVLLKSPIEDEDINERPLPQGQSVHNQTEMTKKKKKKAYILSGPEAAPEPATLVKRLWNQKNISDTECIFIPTPARSPCPHPSQELQNCLDNLLSPSPKNVVTDDWLNVKYDYKESLACARARPFSGRKRSPAGQQGTKTDQGLAPEDSLEEMEEGELRPPVLSGPNKRLEIVSKCKWATEGSRNVVLRVVCEHMAQDRLKHPFWVGKYRIQPISKTVQETEEESTITYKVSISQSSLTKNKEKNEETERIKQLEAQLINCIGKSEVKGLPLLSQVTPAGILKAEKKTPGAPGQITVNGKSYPQAKLELGQMGALHPANRLAAYITGKVCLVNQNATETITTATVSTTTSNKSTTATTAVALTTSVASTHSPLISVKPAVTKPPVGKSFTQVVMNHITSQQHKLPSTSAPQLLKTIKNIINPPSSVISGPTRSSALSTSSPKASTSSRAPDTAGPTDGTLPHIKMVPRSGPAESVKISIAAPRAVAPGGGVKLMQPVTSGQPAVPGQRMVFQMLKTSSGGTMFRNASGQLIQLVPLSQFKALNPNYLIPKQTPVFRFPSPATCKPSSGSSSITNTSSTPATSTVPLLQAQSSTPVQSNTVLTTTAVNSPVDGKKTVSLSGLKPFSSQVQGLPSNTGKSFIKILSIKDPKHTKITINPVTSPVQSTSSFAPAKGGFVLIKPPNLLNMQDLDTQKLESKVKVGLLSTEGSEQSVQSTKLSDSAILEDHCYTLEVKKTSTPCQNPKDGGRLADSSISRTLSKDMQEFGPIEDECDATDALESEIDDEYTAGLDTEEVEVGSDSTELTEDSDMYNDSDSSEPTDQEDLFIDTDSDGGEKDEQKQDKAAELLNLCEKDDEQIDIETFEEKDALDLSKQYKSNHQKQREEKGYQYLLKKNKQEMERRNNLRGCFQKMRKTLNHKDDKASRMAILTQAQEEIHALTEERNQLVKLQEKLKKRRSYYIQLASQLSGKTENSISQKLKEITTKQKYMESQEKVKERIPLHNQTAPKSMIWDLRTKQKSKDNVKDVLHRNAQLSPNSKPIDLSISKKKRLGHKDIASASSEEALRSSQTTKPLSYKTATSQPKPKKTLLPPPLPSRERTRPNILSRSKSQAPAISPTEEQAFVSQVIPLLETVVPCNQIITISNPLQPIDITSSTERHSLTPGVAAVSISGPVVSHTIQLGNPVPIMQPQVLTLTQSPLNISSPVKSVNLPKISNVVSLVPSENLLVTPPVVLQKTNDSPVVQTTASCNPVHVENTFSSSNGVLTVGEGKSLAKQSVEVVPKQPAQSPKVNIPADGATSEKEGKTAPSNETEVENLMSLLDELIFLNQQLNDEPSQTQGGTLSETEVDDVPRNLLSERETGVDRDDERSLSPLFLRLDEDLIASNNSKDEMEDIPPKVDDLVNVIFGSDSPPNSSESEVVAGTNDDSTSLSVGQAKGEAPSLPPLLQMKAGGGTTSNSSKEQASVSWRPMPKLAPLGLKTQEAGQPKATSPHTLKPGLKPPRLRSAHM